MYILGAHPFFQAYFESDMLGRMIFWLLFALSVLSWIVLVQKVRLLGAVQESGVRFQQQFLSRSSEPLTLPESRDEAQEFTNPFSELYKVLRKQTVDVLNKNQRQAKQEENYLSASDVGFVEANLMSAVSAQARLLQKNLFILSTVVSLAPFLGLLGTVWGILLTFSELQASVAGSNQMVIGGLSMALATTVIGLMVAIPALVGHNYLRQWIQDYVVEMENFSSEMLAAVEMQYRKVDVG